MYCDNGKIPNKFEENSLMTPNWIAVFAAGVSAFVLGGVWYSPALFGKAWMKENNLSEDRIKAGNKAKIFGISLLLTLVMSANLAMYLNTPDINFTLGLLYGLLAGVWVFCGIAIVGLFELKSARYIFINGGYCFIALGLMGAILGAWR
jgi:Protein of unknown function (DUF1761)